jgi:VanZ family protein
MINWLEKNRIISVNVVFLIAIIIFIFSSIPGNTEILPQVAFPISYFYHFIIFFLFAFFLIPSIKGKREMSRKFIFIILIVVLIYAVLDEIHQRFVPFRDSSLTDILFDLIGSSFAILLYSFLGNINRKKIKRN